MCSYKDRFKFETPLYGLGTYDPEIKKQCFQRNGLNQEHRRLIAVQNQKGQRLIHLFAVKSFFFPSSKTILFYAVYEISGRVTDAVVPTLKYLVKTKNLEFLKQNDI